MNSSFRILFQNALTSQKPSSPNSVDRQAAVSVVFRHINESPEVLMIQRAVDPNDKWSGHMAFPGGKKDPGDANLLETAKRETFEEIGLDIDQNAAFIKDSPFILSDARSGNPIPLTIHPFIFWLNTPFQEKLDFSEVSGVFWVSLNHLMHKKNHQRFTFKNASLPCIQFHPEKIWGISYQILADILTTLPLANEGIHQWKDFFSCDEIANWESLF